MLDFRLETFLMLCKIGNYTKTADALHITQPAVSQHMKFLEEQYGGKLFFYQGKNLQLTDRGKKLHDFAQQVNADGQRLKTLLQEKNEAAKKLSFGATLSIGEFICPAIITHLLQLFPMLSVHMSVENTQHLMEKLKAGDIQFAFIEGFFHKAEYGYQLFSKEPFVAVCAPQNALAAGVVPFERLTQERLILREKGSGTRAVLDQLLFERNLSEESFDRICEIGNMHAIKHLVAQNCGITFLYRAAAQAELTSGVLKEIHIDQFSATREFNVVYLKKSVFEPAYLAWFECFKEAIHHIA